MLPKHELYQSELRLETRGDRIRTGDHLHPMHVLYQAELLRDTSVSANTNERTTGEIFTFLSATLSTVAFQDYSPCIRMTMISSSWQEFVPELDAALVALKQASFALGQASTTEKNDFLRALADALVADTDTLLKANRQDLDAAQAAGLSQAKIQRLALDEKGIALMASQLQDVAALPDPIGSGRVMVRPNGLRIEKRHVPLGVIAVIYESRPNVTIDVAALCIKSGSAVLLRGGSEATHSNRALFALVEKMLATSVLPKDCVYLLPRTERELISHFLQKKELIDVVIPRGGAELIRTVAEQSKIPVIMHDRGLTHIFVDASADQEKALKICLTAKTSKPSACNAVETVLVHADVAAEFLPKLGKLYADAGVTVRGDSHTQEIIPCEPATDADWDTEYLDLIVSVKVVASLDEAVLHIRQHSSGLAEAILTKDYTNARKFTDTLDAAALYVNASTRFTDGHEFGKGAEMGIGTQKLHARGPVGLKELTTVKYVVTGDGQYK